MHTKKKFSVDKWIYNAYPCFMREDREVKDILIGFLLIDMVGFLKPLHVDNNMYLLSYFCILNVQTCHPYTTERICQL